MRVHELLSGIRQRMHRRPRHDDRGATSVEYAVLVAFLGVAVVGVLAVLGAGLARAYEDRLTSGPVATCPASGCIVQAAYDKLPPPENASGIGRPSISGTAGDRTASIAWNTPASGGGPILGYDVVVGTDAGTLESMTPVRVGVGIHTYTESGLTNGTTYYFSVRAVNGVGVGPWSVALALTPVSPHAPSAPVLQFTMTGGVVNLTWSVPSANGSPIDGYRIEQSPNATPTCATPLTTNACSITGLPPGSTQTIRVSAHNAVGWGDWSNAVTVNVPGACVPIGSSTAPKTYSFSSGTSPVTFDLSAGSGVTGMVVGTVTKAGSPAKTDGTVSAVVNAGAVQWTISGNAAKEWNGTVAYTGSSCAGSSTISVKFTKPNGFNP